MNHVALIGRWTKDIEFKATEGGGVAKCSLAVDEGYGDKKYTNFFDVIMFGKLAEAVTNHSGKGRKVAVTGRLKQERWDKDGRTNSAVRIYASDVEFLDYKENGNGNAKTQPGPSDDDVPPPIDDSDLPL
jgi:single-strand DNA-binding protein